MKAISRFAEAGYAAVAIDYYGRTAGRGERDDSFDWERYLPQVQASEVAADVKAAAAILDGSVFTAGSCFGGSQSWRLAASDLDLTGVIGFYGRPSLVQDVVHETNKPLLLLVAGDDVVTPQEEFQAFAGKLDAAAPTTRCASTRARRTPSSTVPTATGPPPATTPGAASSPSPAGGPEVP